MRSRSSTITKRRPTRSRKLPPIAPGEILQDEFLNLMGITQYRLAKDIGVSPRRINEIVQRKRAITADTAIRLARYFRTSERFWLNLQAQYEIELTKDRLGKRPEPEVRRGQPYHPPRLFLKAGKVFVQLPDGRIERLKVKDEHVRASFAYLNAQGRAEDFARRLVEEAHRRLLEAARKRIDKR